MRGGSLLTHYPVVMKFNRLAAVAAVTLAVVAFAACASVRETALGWSNTPMVGRVAPSLDSGDWVVAEAWQSAAEPAVDWRMIVVFQPS